MTIPETIQKAIDKNQDFDVNEQKIYLRELRKRRGLTQLQLSIKSGVDYNTIRKVEGGHVKNPGILTIAKIADALGFSIDAFVNPPTHNSSR